MAQTNKPVRFNPKVISWTPSAIIVATEDTLIINLPTKLKVIKIGDTYYNIVEHPTTIEPKKIFHFEIEPFPGIQENPMEQFRTIPN